MKLKVRLLTPANLELDEAIEYYDLQLPGLGLRFFQETSAAIEHIRLMPEAWTKIGERTRRCLLKGFPYALFYIIQPGEILIKRWHISIEIRNTMRVESCEFVNAQGRADRRFCGEGRYRWIEWWVLGVNEGDCRNRGSLTFLRRTNKIS
jgi:hypothetical protein